VNSCPSQLQRLGTTSTPTTAAPGRQADVYVVPGGVFIADVNSIAFNHIGYALGTLGLGLTKIFLLRLNCRWTSHLYYVTNLFIVSVIVTDIAVIIVILATLSSSIPSSSKPLSFPFYM
jgi:hypothetical protein